MRLYAAATAHEKLIAGQPLTCRGKPRDRYGQLIAVCYVGNIDINEQMVLQGWAMAYQRYSTDYAQAEQAAMAVGAGMWQCRFLSPWQWRRRKRQRTR